jgi:23S rRNA (adenine-N6)-dimethyltransferase
MRNHPHRSVHGGRHELGQNFLTHRPTIRGIVDLVAATEGPILEIGAGDGALTIPLAGLGRDLVAIDIDEHRVRTLRRRLPRVRVQHADAMRHPLDRPVLVGNVPYHLTTPILRRMLSRRGWRHAILLTQWEVARKRAGVGGRTMMTAQTAPWYDFALHDRVPAHGFSPRPSVDGGLLTVSRRPDPLVPASQRGAYEAFVRRVFTGRGRGIEQILGAAAPQLAPAGRRHAIEEAAIHPPALPRDLTPEQWAVLWRHVASAPTRGARRTPRSRL